MTRDFANQLDLALAALQSVFQTPRENYREHEAARQEAYRQLAYLRGRLDVEPCAGDPSFRDLIRRWWRK